MESRLASSDKRYFTFDFQVNEHYGKRRRGIVNWSVEGY